MLQREARSAVAPRGLQQLYDKYNLPEAEHRGIIRSMFGSVSQLDLNLSVLQSSSPLSQIPTKHCSGIMIVLVHFNVIMQKDLGLI